MCVGRVYEYTGDVSFVREMYEYIKQGIDWLLNDMDHNKNYFPEGYGIMEVKGLNAELIDVSVYTQQALEAAFLLATAMKDEIDATKYAGLAALLKQKINKDFWDDSNNSYCDN
jgi:glycogen debranching enzyme